MNVVASGTAGVHGAEKGDDEASNEDEGDREASRLSLEEMKAKQARDAARSKTDLDAEGFDSKAYVNQVT